MKYYVDIATEEPSYFESEKGMMDFLETLTDEVTGDYGKIENGELEVIGSFEYGEITDGIFCTPHF
jgi:hypothetical protein